MVESERFARGRTFHTSFLIVDSKSIKNTDTAKEKGYDVGKKISGIKLHMAVDRFAASDLHNQSRCIEMVQLFISTSNNLGRLQNMLMDSGYSGDSFAGATCKQILGCSVEVVKKSDLHSFKVMAKRWIVERTFAWLFSSVMVANANFPTQSK